MAHHDTAALDRVFLWQGDVRILLAIVKYMEDKLNVAYDTGVVGVQVILLIEDNIRYYSSFLPIMYTELINHSQWLVPEGVNVAHKILRMRARPKILLCDTLRGSLGATSRLRGRRPGRHLRHRVPAGRTCCSPRPALEFARQVRAASRTSP